MALPRRLVNEWITAIEIDPDSRTLFVEGFRDQSLLESFLRGRAPRLVVRQVSEIDFAGRKIETTPFCGGHRARAVTFSGILNVTERAGQNAVCLIDADFEPINPVVPKIPSLRLTPFASIHAGYIQQEFVEDVARRALKAPANFLDWDLLMDACIFAAAFRVTRYRAYPRAHAIDIATLLQEKAGALFIDRQGYTLKFKHRNGPAVPESVPEILQAVDGVKALMVGDVRSYINYHDFVALYTHVLRASGILDAAFRQEHVEAILYGAEDPNDLADHETFAALVEWGK